MSQNIRQVLSVGIDVGTTTTQLVFSELTLASRLPGGDAPLARGPLSRSDQAAIIAKKIIFQSDIAFTPLRGPEEVDAAALERLVRRVYRQAGISPAQVETGAIIITGETAKKRNADSILAALSALAGDFVVTVAGPTLESLLAGRGSGADAFSREHYTTVTNVDIGGGSANSATFRQGDLIAAAAMNFGGRILEIDRSEGRIRHLAAPARLISASLDLPFSPGYHPTLAELRRFTDCMAGLAVELIEGSRSPLAGQLLLTAPAPVSGAPTPLFFSGGVGYYFYQPLSLTTIADVALHGDVGPLLAESLRRHPVIQRLDIRQPPETSRATVLGASSQTVTLSGSTIWIDDNILPVRNVPVLRPRWASPSPPGRVVAEAVRAAAARWDLDPAASLFAVAPDLSGALDYPALTEISAGLAAFARAHLPAHQPLIVVLERDYARVLGQTIKRLAPDRPLLIVDQVNLTEGDYIDVGRPLLDGRVVPLSVKTLIFYR